MTATVGEKQRRTGIRVGFAALLSAIGWFALFLQVAIVVQEARATGVSVLSAEVRVFSFFTVLTNLLVALVMTAEVLQPRFGAGKFLTRPTVQAATAVYIIVVGVVYHLFLRNVWNPQGWQKVADELLHVATPSGYFLYWLIWARNGATKWTDSLRWLCYPLAYAIYTLVHGIWTQSYPYPFLNVVHLGYPRVFLNMLALTVAMVFLGWIIVGIDRLRRKSAQINQCCTQED